MIICPFRHLYRWNKPFFVYENMTKKTLYFFCLKIPTVGGAPVFKNRPLKLAVIRKPNFAKEPRKGIFQPSLVVTLTLTIPELCGVPHPGKTIVGISFEAIFGYTHLKSNKSILFT